jgi:DNA-binding PadR family transcriptional regulator
VIEWFQRWWIKRQTDTETRILGAFDGDWWCYGLDLMRRARMRAGRFYPALDRLESSGMVEAKWDDVEIRTGLRRRMYRRSPFDRIPD